MKQQALSVMVGGAEQTAAPQLLDVAIALLGVARGRGIIERRTLIEASEILLKADVADGDEIIPTPAGEPRMARGGAGKVKRRASPRFGRKATAPRAASIAKPQSVPAQPASAPALAFNGVGIDGAVLSLHGMGYALGVADE